MALTTPCLDSPYGELNFAPPNQYFIDLRQMEANLHQILITICKTHKMQVQQIKVLPFPQKEKPLRDAPQHHQGLGSTIWRYLPLLAAICRYLPLFGVSLSTICRYLPLAIPLFAANFNNLPLFAANYVYRKLPIRVIYDQI